METKKDICTLFYESILYTKKIVETAREIKKIYEDSTCYDTPQILDVCLSTVSNKNPTIQVTNLDETGIEERIGVEHNTVGFRESYDKKYIDIDGLEVFELVKKKGVN